jgi:hypothetical protein
MCPPEETQKSVFQYEMLPDVLICMALCFMNTLRKDKLNPYSHMGILGKTCGENNLRCVALEIGFSTKTVC